MRFEVRKLSYTTLVCEDVNGDDVAYKSITIKPDPDARSQFLVSVNYGRYEPCTNLSSFMEQATAQSLRKVFAIQDIESIEIKGPRLWVKFIPGTLGKTKSLYLNQVDQALNGVQTEALVAPRTTAHGSGDRPAIVNLVRRTRPRVSLPASPPEAFGPFADVVRHMRENPGLNPKQVKCSLLNGPGLPSGTAHYQLVAS